MNIDNEHIFAFTFSDDKVRSGNKSTNLLVDSCATSHIVVDHGNFLSFEEGFDAKKLACGSKASIVLGKWNAKVNLYDVNGNLLNLAYTMLYMFRHTTKYYLSQLSATVEILQLCKERRET